MFSELDRVLAESLTSTPALLHSKSKPNRSPFPLVEITQKEAERILETEGVPIYRSFLEPQFLEFRLDKSYWGELAWHYLVRWDYPRALDCLERYSEEHPEIEEVRDLRERIVGLFSQLRSWVESNHDAPKVTDSNIRALSEILFQSPFFHLQPFPHPAKVHHLLNSYGRTAWFLARLETQSRLELMSEALGNSEMGPLWWSERCGLAATLLTDTLPRSFTRRLAQTLLSRWSVSHSRSPESTGKPMLGGVFLAYMNKGDDRILVDSARSLLGSSSPPLFTEIAVDRLQRLALKVAPKQADLLREIATRRLREHDYYGVAQLMDEAMEFDPNDTEALRLRITAHIHNEEFEAALSLCERMTDLAPHESWGWEAWGYGQLRLGNEGDGLEKYRRASDAESGNGEARLNLAALFLWEGRREDAIGILNSGFHSKSETLRKDLLLSLPPATTTAPPLHNSPVVDSFLKDRLGLKDPADGPRLKLYSDDCRPCPLCGGDQILPIRINPANGWPISKCETCRFIHVNPLPNDEEIVASYHEMYLEGVYQDQFQAAKEKRWEQDKDYIDPFSDLIEWLKTSAKIDWERQSGSRLLDIGCASGLFMERMADLGFRVEGLETSSELAGMARELGHSVRTQLLEEAGYEAGAFDFVSCLHVLEHVPDPFGFLKEIHRILKGDGTLVLALPVSHCLPHVLYGDSFLDQPDHLSFFTPDQLGRLLTDSGFQIQDCRSVLSSAFEHGWLNQIKVPMPVKAKKLYEKWMMGDIIEVLVRT